MTAAPQCLLTLMDSPLNRAGMLQVYLRTRHGAWGPSSRLPAIATDLIENKVRQYFGFGCWMIFFHGFICQFLGAKGLHDFFRTQHNLLGPSTFK